MSIIDQAMEVITGVIERPTANLTLTVLLLAALTLAFLVVDVVILLLISPRRKKRVRKTIRRWIPDAPAETPDGSPDAERGTAGNADAEQGVGSLAASPVAASAQPGGSIAAGRPEPDGGASSPGGAASAASPGGSTADVAVSRSTRRPWWRTVGMAVSAATVPLLALGSLVATYAITGVDTVCMESCHADSAAVAQVHENDHRYRARCVECHEEGSGADLVTAIASRSTMLVAEAGLTDAAPSRPVTSAACLGCHEDVLQGVLESDRVNVRMSHAEPIASGMDCVDCHGPVGHLGESARISVSMDVCLGCHDGDAAPTECSACHTTDIAAVGRDSLSGEETRITGSGRYQYPPVEVSDRDCGGCHELETQCDPCHGTRLPHPERFVQGYHAKDAAWSKKETCFRCHEEVWDCQQCHSPFSVGHLDSWVRDHQSAEWDSGCGCHGRGTNEDIPICVFCHDDAPSQKVGEEHITRP